MCVSQKSIHFADEFREVLPRDQCAAWVAGRRLYEAPATKDKLAQRLLLDVAEKRRPAAVIFGANSESASLPSAVDVARNSAVTVFIGGDAKRSGEEKAAVVKWFVYAKSLRAWEAGTLAVRAQPFDLLRLDHQRPGFLSPKDQEPGIDTGLVVVTLDDKTQLQLPYSARYIAETDAIIHHAELLAEEKYTSAPVARLLLPPLVRSPAKGPVAMMRDLQQQQHTPALLPPLTRSPAKGPATMLRDPQQQKKRKSADEDPAPPPAKRAKVEQKPLTQVEQTTINSIYKLEAEGDIEGALAFLLSYFKEDRKRPDKAAHVQEMLELVRRDPKVAWQFTQGWFELQLLP